MKTTQTQNDPSPLCLLGGNPGAIEAQEAQGQQELVESCQLPRNENSGGGRMLPAKEKYESMGIKVAPFIDKVPRFIQDVVRKNDNDELFVTVILPDGWKKEATDHSMWNNLVDDKGYIRASFFYKAAFYDRDAFINFNTRYVVTQKYTEDAANGKYPSYACVVDQGTKEIIFKTAVTEEYGAYPERAEAEAWLKEKYPDHENILAYWDV